MSYLNGIIIPGIIALFCTYVHHIVLYFNELFHVLYYLINMYLLCIMFYSCRCFQLFLSQLVISQFGNYTSHVYSKSLIFQYSHLKNNVE